MAGSHLHPLYLGAYLGDALHVVLTADLHPNKRDRLIGFLMVGAPGYKYAKRTYWRRIAELRELGVDVLGVAESERFKRQ